ncbi:MAG: cupin domain-containing protein [Planctomycetes bacterium]|nr:cupin domain-containing protein [Planctomycetota bacterium]MCB9903017.1 cupin domain-containing protein [Planctomycetota bacterium]
MTQRTHTARSRFGNVANEQDVPEEVWNHEPAGIAVKSREMAPAVGSRDLGYCVVTLEPGSRSCPYHFHHSEEELFVVLEGRGMLRQGDESSDEEELELSVGDFVAFPPGTGIAHQIRNHTTELFRYLAFSNRLPYDVAEYPDSDKILVRGPRRRMLRRNPTLEYFDGEE